MSIWIPLEIAWVIHKMEIIKLDEKKLIQIQKKVFVFIDVEVSLWLKHQRTTSFVPMLRIIFFVNIFLVDHSPG